MQSILKNILFAFSFAILVWLGYIVFFTGNDAALTSSTSQAAVEGAAFLAKLKDLEAIKLDNHFFTDPRFQSFVDNRQDVTQTPYGRPDPFAPLKSLQTVKK